MAFLKRTKSTLRRSICSSYWDDVERNCSSQCSSKWSLLVATFAASARVADNLRVEYIEIKNTWKHFLLTFMRLPLALYSHPRRANSLTTAGGHLVHAVSMWDGRCWLVYNAKGIRKHIEKKYGKYYNMHLAMNRIIGIVHLWDWTV